MSKLATIQQRLKLRARRAVMKATTMLIGVAVIFIFIATYYGVQLNAALGTTPGSLAGAIIFTLLGFILLLAAVWYEKKRHGGSTV